MIFSSWRFQPVFHVCYHQKMLGQENVQAQDTPKFHDDGSYKLFIQSIWISLDFLHHSLQNNGDGLANWLCPKLKKRVSTPVNIFLSFFLLFFLWPIEEGGIPSVFEWHKQFGIYWDVSFPSSTQGLLTTLLKTSKVFQSIFLSIFFRIVTNNFQLF